MDNIKDTVVTVVMPAYRETEGQIRSAIESIIKQTWEAWRYIIVLDDPENKPLKKIIEEYVHNDSRIMLYINERNMGCPYTRNRGVQLADTEYIAVMDADDIARPGRLEILLNKIIKDDLDLVAGCVSVMNDKGKWLYNMNDLPLQHDEIVKKMRINNCMPHSTWLLKRAVYLTLGGYTNMQGCEDYDFLFRAIDRGYRLGTSKEILLDYRLSSQSISRNNLFKQYLMMRYLQDKYCARKSCYKDYEEILAKKYTEKKAEKYAKASRYFENALEYKVRHKYFRMAGALLLVVVSSKDYCIKILRYIGQNT